MFWVSLQVSRTCLKVLIIFLQFNIGNLDCQVISLTNNSKKLFANALTNLKSICYDGDENKIAFNLIREVEKVYKLVGIATLFWCTTFAT